MAGSQLYIGIPNGVVICVDKVCGGDFAGRFYHKYSREGVVFSSTGYMVRRMEELFDLLDYPRVSTNMRSFRETSAASGRRRTNGKREELEKVMSDNELLSQHGYQGTFIVRVQHRQNSTWQGRITWADKDMTMTFRSVWEMIHLMESAMDTDTVQDEEDRPKDWEAPAETE